MKTWIKKCVKCGFHKSKKVINKYDKLISRSKKRKELLSILKELQHTYATFDDTFSDADEYPYSKENLEFQIFLLEEDIKELEIV